VESTGTKKPGSAGGEKRMLLDGVELLKKRRGYAPRLVAAAYITSHPGRHEILINRESPAKWNGIPLELSVNPGDLPENSEIEKTMLRVPGGEAKS